MVASWLRVPAWQISVICVSDLRSDHCDDATCVRSSFQCLIRFWVQQQPPNIDSWVRSSWCLTGDSGPKSNLLDWLCLVLVVDYLLVKPTERSHLLLCQIFKRNLLLKAMKETPVQFQAVTHPSGFNRVLVVLLMLSGKMEKTQHVSLKSSRSCPQKQCPQRRPRTWNPVWIITRFCRSSSDETQKSLMMITVIAAQFVCLHLYPHPHHLQVTPPPPFLSNLPSENFPWVFSCNYEEEYVIGFHGDLPR